MSFFAGSVGVARSLAVIAQAEADGQPQDDWRLGFWRDGEWRQEITVEFKPVAIAPVPEREDAWVVLGTHGEILWIDQATGQHTQRREEVGSSSQAGFTALAWLGNTLAAAQMGRRAFGFSGSGWHSLGAGLQANLKGETAGFLGMVASSEDLFACGWRGEIWRLHAGNWIEEDSPTSSILTAATATAEGEVFICGRLGTILRGRPNRWVVVDHQQTEEDFWSLTLFRGDVYVSSLRGIYQLQGDELNPVDDDTPDASHYRLSANDEIMLSIGNRTLLVTDGKQWTQIL
jgi:hypothetical protein